jgi:hypothetical protein
VSSAAGGGEAQVSWKAIEENAAVVSSDGEEVGRIAEIAGDPTADIFTGLVVSLGMLGANRYLPAERVAEIWPSRVQVDLTRTEIEALPEYEEPQSERWQPDTGAAGFFRRLFGRGRP